MDKTCKKPHKFSSLALTTGLVGIQSKIQVQLQTMFVFCTQGQEGRDQIRYESLVHFQLEIRQDKDTEKRERERSGSQPGIGPSLLHVLTSDHRHSPR